MRRAVRAMDDTTGGVVHNVDVVDADEKKTISSRLECCGFRLTSVKCCGMHIVVRVFKSFDYLINSL